MFIEIEDIFFTIFYTIIYTIISVFMSFRLTEILDGDKNATVEKLVRHFLLWPVELLFILILGIKYYLEDKMKIKK